ncbi:MAG: alpha/beta fold hydrolase, partial [Pseudomonadota bacterium]
MRRVFLIGVLGLLGLGGVLSCGSEPAANLLLQGARLQAGLQAETVRTKAGPVRYLVGGQGEPVLMVHGIYARKEHWLNMSRRLTDGYRVYMIDLPGFGDNPPLGRGGYRLSR